MSKGTKTYDLVCDGCGKTVDMFDDAYNAWESAVIEGIDVTCCDECKAEIWSVAMEISDRAEREAADAQQEIDNAAENRRNAEIEKRQAQIVELERQIDSAWDNSESFWGPQATTDRCGAEIRVLRDEIEAIQEAEIEAELADAVALEHIDDLVLTPEVIAAARKNLDPIIRQNTCPDCEQIMTGPTCACMYEPTDLSDQPVDVAPYVAPRQECELCGGRGKTVVLTNDAITIVECRICKGAGDVPTCVWCDGVGYGGDADWFGTGCPACRGTGIAPAPFVPAEIVAGPVDTQPVEWF